MRFSKLQKMLHVSKNRIFLPENVVIKKNNNKKTKGSIFLNFLNELITTSIINLEYIYFTN